MASLRKGNSGQLLHLKSIVSFLSLFAYQETMKGSIFLSGFRKQIFLRFLEIRYAFPGHRSYQNFTFLEDLSGTII